MKIEVKKRAKKEYYDEILYIASFLERVRKNPTKGVNQYSKKMLKSLLISIIGFIAVATLYIFDNDSVFMVLVGIYAFLSIFAFIIYLKVKKRLDLLLNYDGVKEVNINKTEIKYFDKSKNFKISIDWDNIVYVLISKYSICFIPKDNNSILISITIDYKDELLKTLKDYKKEDLVVYNKKACN